MAAVQTILGLASVFLLFKLLKLRRNPDLRDDDDFAAIDPPQPSLPMCTSPPPLPMLCTSIREVSFDDHLYSSYPVYDGVIPMDDCYIGVPALFGCTHRGDGNLVVVGNDPLPITFANLLEAQLRPLGKGKRAYLCLPSGSDLYLTLKQLKGMTLSSSEFHNHVHRLEGISHDHLLPVLAYCYDQDYKFILYDFSTRGSLFSLIHDRGPFHFQDVLTVSLGVASAIKHLHDHGIPHGNIKSSYVIVINDMHVRLLASGLDPTHPHGSLQDDVYDFGVLLLELLSRKNPKLHISYEGQDLNFVDGLEKMMKKGDGRFLDLLSNGRANQIEDLLLLALDCLDKKCDMSLVTQRIVQLQDELCSWRSWFMRYFWFWGY